MLKTFAVLFRFYFFWLLFFFIDRLIFLLYYTDRLKGIPFSEICKSFFYGLWMDLSMAGYISALPLLLFIPGWLFPRISIPHKFLKWYTRTLVVIFSFVSVANFNIYREWGSKISHHAIDFLLSGPGEALAASSSSPLFSSFLIFLTLALTGLWLAKAIIDYQRPKDISFALKVAVSIFLIGLNFLAIRGGWQLAPINESMAYFSDKPILNHASVNTEWSLFRDLLKNKQGSSNPYTYYKPEESEALVKELYTNPVTDTVQILTTRKPNVVIIIIESFTADVIESLGGEKGVAPNMEKLAANGLLFSNIYASGDRTEKGLASVISAFPAQAIQSIMKENNRQEKLPSLSQVFFEQGYHTSFYYGGESEFANMKSYILSHSYQRLTDKHAYNKKDMNSKWGAYDEVVFRTQLSDLNKEPQPFFSTLLTLSNHEPFELPGKLRFGTDSEENKFRSTAFYTDSCIADFLNQAKKQAWYKNTLFVIVADHGHRLPRNRAEIYYPARFRIPLLFYGDVIKPEYRGKRIEKVGNQTDIAATLLTQLKINADRFKWSKDLLNPNTKEFSFYNWDNGFGFATPTQIISFDNVGKNIIYKLKPDASSDDELRYGKAYMQEVYQSYIDY
jgi:phosphoglycerol transferase MdoB-like AlkP superfamily enzyme